jgi:predicted GNAT family acetyltransferase
MTASLCDELAREGRRACLFARKTNIAAIRSYVAVGFALADDFAISYFS